LSSDHGLANCIEVFCMRYLQLPSRGFFAALTLVLGLISGLQLTSLASHPAFAISTCTSTVGTNDSDEQTVVSMINALRQNNSLPPLTPTSALTRAAHTKSDDMAKTGIFAHDDLTTTMARLAACGNNVTAVGENIAGGNTGGAATFNQWLNSPEHKANMLNANFKAVGVGRAFASTGSVPVYWTTEFSNVVDSALPGGSTATSNPTQPAPQNLTGSSPATAAGNGGPWTWTFGSGTAFVPNSFGFVQSGPIGSTGYGTWSFGSGPGFNPNSVPSGAGGNTGFGTLPAEPGGGFIPSTGPSPSNTGFGSFP
jgi:uncharacterized protein YkwD